MKLEEQTKQVKHYPKESELAKMWDSEFMAYMLSELFKNKEDYIPDYIFNRIDTILKAMAKEEMN